MTRTKIIKFLQNNHKHFAKLDGQNFDAWVQLWDDNKTEGYAHIEIRAFETWHGRTVVLEENEKKVLK